MAHIIRLRGAWDIERVTLPVGRDCIRFIRRFGCSKGLKSASQVWLTIADVAGPAALQLNGASLGNIIGQEGKNDSGAQRCPAKFPITSLLQPRNLLLIDLSINSQSTRESEPEYLGSVQLQIE